MSRLHAVVVALLLASVARSSQLETVFFAFLPCPAAPSLGSSMVFGDGLYTICGEWNSAAAFNLTTRTTIWVTSNFSTSIGSIATYALTSQLMLLSFSSSPQIIALSTKTGQQLWTQSGYQLQSPAAFIYGSTIYAQVVLPSQFYALQAFDLATGTPGFFQFGNELRIDGNTAFIAQYSIGSGNQDVNSSLRAVDIPTNTTLWTVPCSDQEPGTLLPAISSEYVAISNVSGPDEVAVVLHRSNGSVVQSFQAFNGFAASGVAQLRGNMLFALIGFEYQRYVLADLTTGYITWTRSADAIGNGGVASGNALVTIRSSLVLTVTPIGNNSPSFSIPNVPTLPYPAIFDFGFGVVLVPNLQGYTAWDANTGDFIGSNEQAPNAALTAPMKWNGLSITVSGNTVTALKVVA